MADCVKQRENISYELMNRVTDLLICSRCFRRNVCKSIKTLLSHQHRPTPICAECSGEIKPGHVAKVINFS
jgi:hypothetical protein